MDFTNHNSTPPPTRAQRYYPTIDGLRAIAVVAVLLFHAGFGCSGGYVGVDVFFVISGYLITARILRDIEAGEFNLLEFWERRIRRIAPASLGVIALTLAAAWFVYLPDDYALLGRAVMAQAVMGSNFFHWRATGYFGPDVQTLPLLHTWTLAVEEQFYVLLPVALLAVGSRRRPWLNPLITAACLASFALGMWATSRYREAAFYLLPTRAWELLLGSLLAAYPGWGPRLPQPAREVTAWAGLGAIGGAMVCFNAGTPFPGVAALLPCLGTAALIWANHAKLTTAGKAIACRPFVFVGKISYSLYLFHWPVLVLGRYWFRDERLWGLKVGLLTAAFLLAVLSWLLVEIPVRTKRVLGSRHRLLFVTAAGTLLLLTCGLVAHAQQGFPLRFPSNVLTYAGARHERAFQTELDARAAENGKLTRLGAPVGAVRCLLWGDSHAMALAPALDAVCREKQIGAVAAMHSQTPPVLGYVPRGEYSLEGDTPRFNAAVLKFAIEQRLQLVMMAGAWRGYADNPEFAAGLKATVNTLTTARLRVVVVRDVPHQQGDAPMLVARAALWGGDVRKVGVSLAEHRLRNRTADELFARLAGPRVMILDPTVAFVDDSSLCRAEFDGKSMYRDAGHLSVAGSLRLCPLFEAVLHDLQ